MCGPQKEGCTLNVKPMINPWAVFPSQEKAFKKGLTLDALVYELTKQRVVSSEALKRRDHLEHISVDDEKDWNVP
jgi:hypothetical protein